MEADQFARRMLTEEICQRVLSRAHNELVEKLNVEGAIDAIRSELGPHDVQDIENLFTEEAKCRVLIRRVSKAGVRTYQKFKDFLKADQNILFQIVEKHEQELRIDNREIDDNYLTDEVRSREAPKIQGDWESKVVYLQGQEQLKHKAACCHMGVDHEIERIGKHVQDGRLVKLSPAYIEHVKDCLCDPNNIALGGFGTVYITRDKVKGFDQRLVLKEISVGAVKSTIQILGSVTNEKLASRVMHFAIVPLLAFHDDLKNGNYYFIAPYLENGDLYEAIKYDRQSSLEHSPVGILLRWRTRLKVMFQTACAIDYLHRGNSLRGTILHMDIKSKNIVLDSKRNARLIDFGLAREVKEGSELHTMTPVYGTKGYHPTVEHRRLTPQHDYHNFGVVMRELLTGLDPVQPVEEYKLDLRKWDSRRVARNIDYRIWISKSEAEKCATVADLCIESINQAGKVTSSDICKELKDLMRKGTVPPWDGLDDNRCEICIVNVHDANNRVSDINHDDCTCKIKICHACMRNSYFNPIKCYGCEKEIKAIIGDGWGALLIAGYDEKEGVSFQKDVNEFGDAITSTVLPAMCISNSCMVVIDFNTNTHETSSRIEDAFIKLQSNGVHTLVFLYSGHHGDKGFLIGKNKYYHMDNLSNQIKNFTGLKKIIAFLDCCFPKPINAPESVCLIQFNATGPKDKAESIKGTGSIFTQFLVQALTMKASGGKCQLKDCDCSMDGDFITLGSLWHYIELHRQRGGLAEMEPHQSTKNVDWKNIYLSYNYTFKVKFCFDIRVPGTNISQKIDVVPTQVTDFKALKPEILFPELIKLVREHFKCQGDIRSNMSAYADILVIEVDTGPRDTQEIENMEKLLLAWNAKRLLRCTFRQYTAIDVKKPVGILLKNGNIVSETLSEYYPGKRAFDIKDLEQFKETLVKMETESDNTEKNQPLNEFTDVIYAIVHATKYNKLKQRQLGITSIDLLTDGSVTLVYLELTNPEETCEKKLSVL